MEEGGQSPCPRSELAQEGNPETACVQPMSYSLGFQAPVQTPAMELLGTAANKKFFQCQCHGVCGALGSCASPEHGWVQPTAGDNLLRKGALGRKGPGLNGFRQVPQPLAAFLPVLPPPW